MNWTKEEIVAVLANPEGQTGKHKNRYLVYRMLQALYQRQTSTEQEAELTIEHNGVGFNGVDADFLSSVAKNSLKYQGLTEKQAAFVAKRLKKYAKQLAGIAAVKLQMKLPTPTCPDCGGAVHVEIEDCPVYVEKVEAHYLRVHAENQNSQEVQL